MGSAAASRPAAPRSAESRSAAPRSAESGSACTVLVEGPSDAAALRVLAAAHGPAAPRDVRIVDMGGATNIGRYLRELAAASPGTRVAGLCDAAEERFFVRALAAGGATVRTRADLAQRGFFVCVPDLEGELIAALGAPAVVRVLAEIGDGHRFSRFQGQVHWRGRDLAEQVHRFAGSGAGRKVLLAERLARQLTPVTTPRPLAALLEFAGRTVGSAPGPR